MTETIEKPAAAATTPQARVDAWLANFEAALAVRDVERVVSMFAVDSFWRDLVSFTWNIKTMEGRDQIADMLGARLIEAIRVVAAGGTVIDPELAATALRTGSSPLTEREADVLRLVGSGRTTDAIAEELFLSRGTVRNYLSSAMAKLDATTRTEASAVAMRRGWV
jgi:DNA-binding CsgD family transcriptional regulator